MQINEAITSYFTIVAELQQNGDAVNIKHADAGIFVKELFNENTREI